MHPFSAPENIRKLGTNGVNYYLAGNRNTLNKAHAIAIIIIFNLNFS